MASIKVGVALVTLSETTLRELLEGCAEARNLGDFTDDPMPEGDISTKTYIRERARRGAIRIESRYSDITFEILLDGTQVGGGESAGYLFRPVER